MKAVLLHAKLEVRAAWRSWLVLAALVAIAGGAVVALAAGARRTDTAYPRFLKAERAPDIVMFLGAPGLPQPAQVQRLPEVADSGVAVALQATEPDFIPLVASDNRFAQQLDRFKFLAGRAVRPDQPYEVVVGFLFARSRHLHIGSPLTLTVPGRGPGVTLRVVGVEAAPFEFPPRPASSGSPTVYLSPAFLRTPAGARFLAAGLGGTEVVLRLRHGVHDVQSFQADLQRLAATPFPSESLADQSANVQRSLHLQAVALWLMAAAAGLAAGLVLLQLLIRQGSDDAAAHSTLRALGMTSSQVFGSGMVRIASMAATGAVGTVVVAAALSPLLPLGDARVAEPHPGFAFDAAAIGIGAAGVLLIVTLLGAAASYRTAIIVGERRISERSRPDRPSAVASALTLAGLPLVVVTGLRLALQPGRGRTAVPVRATLAAAVIGVAAMAAAVTFGASLGHLLATPGLYGVDFDAHLQTNDNSDITPAVSVAEDDGAVGAVAVGFTGAPLQVGRLSFDAQATTNVRGSILPTLIEGRLPTGPDEIVLGSRTMRDLHTHIGQTIQVGVTGITGPRPMRVVGRGVLAPINDTEQLGQGAVVAPAAMPAFGVLAPAGFKAPPPGDAFVRFRADVAKSAAIATLQRRLGASNNISVDAPSEPTDVANFGQVRDLPQILAGLLGVVAAVTVAYLLVSAIRRRRRDLAVLKTLGFVPRQVSAVIAWQATTVALVALGLGVPLGLAAGRSAWSAVAGQIGVVPRPEVPWPLIVGLSLAALLIANLVAIGPALAAGRIHPAAVLRSE